MCVIIASPLEDNRLGMGREIDRDRRVFLECQP
jgi:hypothetical protein